MTLDAQVKTTASQGARRAAHLCVRCQPPTGRFVSALELDTVYEDDDVLVLNKPAGLVVHQPPATGPARCQPDCSPASPRGCTPRAGIVHIWTRHFGLWWSAKLAAVTARRADRYARSASGLLAIVHGQVPDGCSASTRHRSRPVVAHPHGGRGVEAGSDRRSLRRAPRRLLGASVQPAHRTHPSDPGSPRITRPSAGRRCDVWRPGCARHDAPGPACNPARLRAPVERTIRRVRGRPPA